MTIPDEVRKLACRSGDRATAFALVDARHRSRPPSGRRPASGPARSAPSSRVTCISSRLRQFVPPVLGDHARPGRGLPTASRRRSGTCSPSARGRPASLADVGASRRGRPPRLPPTRGSLRKDSSARYCGPVHPMSLHEDRPVAQCDPRPRWCRPAAGSPDQRRIAVHFLSTESVNNRRIVWISLGIRAIGLR